MPDAVVHLNSPKGTPCHGHKLTAQNSAPGCPVPRSQWSRFPSARPAERLRILRASADLAARWH